MTKNERIRLLEERIEGLTGLVLREKDRMASLLAAMGTDIRHIKDHLITADNGILEVAKKNSKLHKMLVCSEQKGHDLVISHVDNIGRSKVTYVCKNCGIKFTYTLDELSKEEIAALKQLGLVD
jgi:hypothetical protein